MDVDATQSTVYSNLPRTVRTNNEDVLEPQSSESDPLLSFIKQAVPRARINQGLAADLKYKIHYLDNDIGFKKHRFDKSAAKKKILSAREKRKLKLMKLDLKKQEYKYADYLPLHQLWFDYIRDLLQMDKITPKNKSEAEGKLLKADYHGAMVTVSASKCPSLIGQTGIVVMETKNTFQIIRKDDKLRMLPKRDTNYTIKLGDYVLTIYGNQLQVKPCMRTVRKFKYKPTVDL